MRGGLYIDEFAIVPCRVIIIGAFVIARTGIRSMAVWDEYNAAAVIVVILYSVRLYFHGSTYVLVCQK